MKKSDPVKDLLKKIDSMARIAGRSLTPEDRELIKGLKADAKEEKAADLKSPGKRGLKGGDGIYDELKWAKNVIELATAVGVDRRTIYNHLKREENPGRTHDGRYNIEAWMKYLEPFRKDDDEDEGATFAGDDGEPVTKAEWEIRKIKTVIRKLEYDQGIREGQYSKNEDVIRWESETMNQVMMILLAVPGKLAPLIEMRSVVECEKYLKDAIDEAILIIHDRPWPEAGMPVS